MIVIAALCCVVAFAFAVTVIHAWREIHHLYYGLAVVAVATWLDWPQWVAFVGLVVMADDAAQHVVQIWTPEWRSPLHRAYRRLLYEPFTRR